MKLIICAAFVFAVACAAPQQQANEVSNLEELFQSFKLNDFVEITKNGYQNNEIEGRSDANVEARVEDFIKGHDFTFKLPLVDSQITLGARNLDSEEVDVKVRFSSNNQVEERGKKHKLKKILAPILIFILIKAMVLIPLALGILAIKTWNALQLGFVSFVVALAMGVWQLCKKISGDNAPPQIVAHDPWNTAAAQYAARAFNDEAQQMAYSAYVQ